MSVGIYESFSLIRGVTVSSATDIPLMRAPFPMIFSDCPRSHYPRRSNSYARAMTDQHHAEKLQVAKAEQKALETAIAKSQKKFREADTTGQPQETEETGLSDTGQSKG